MSDDKDVASWWNGKAAVVTGAARGQGAAEALRLLQAGATVYALDVLPESDATWAELRAAAGEDAERLRIRVADVARESDWLALADEISAAGVPLYGLVNNAGVTLRKTVTETTHAEWRCLLD
ncbi:SDR family NAD(P)-dependent oxidoreductase, partial [Achromobacter aegrifaciens]|uniref:SDR family NAD(P)-dependent oxidoreductase n=1 Tax=Achromobacter aegrifaciens TaxID=1287736 RepID=UPI0021652647